MKKSILIALLIILFSLFMGHMAFSEEETGETTETELMQSKFYDPELLIQTLSAGQPATSEEPGEGTETEEVVSDPRVEAFVATLSEEQVFAFNRALNNAVKSQLYSDIIYDMDILESLDVTTLTKQDINAITKAFEEEAKFNKLYAKTGNEKFLAMAETKKTRFLAKGGVVLEEEETGTETDPALGSSESGTEEGTAALSSKEARKEAKMAAIEAKKAAKLAAKDAKKEAKAAAKEAKKQAKENKGKAKGKNK